MSSSPLPSKVQMFPFPRSTLHPFPSTGDWWSTCRPCCGQSGWPIGDDQVYLAVKCVVYHLFDPLAVLGAGAGDVLIYLDPLSDTSLYALTSSETLENKGYRAFPLHDSPWFYWLFSYPVCSVCTLLNTMYEGSVYRVILRVIVHDWGLSYMIGVYRTSINWHTLWLCSWVKINC